MSKHPLDHDRSVSSDRFGRYLSAERSQKPSDAAKILQRRPRKEADTRLTKFTRIERGIEH